MDIITSHINADFDALASAIGAKKIYPDAVIVFPGSLEKKVRDFVDAFHPVEIKKLKDIDIGNVKRLILVDTKHPDRIGQIKELLTKSDIKIHIYDHHPIKNSDIRGELEVIEHVGAVSTIFTEIIQKKKIILTPLDATLLCLGIYEETGSLTYASTTPRDLMAASYLLKRGANLNIVSDFLKIELSREEFTLLNDLMQSLREIVIHSVRIKIGKATMDGFGDVAHLAHKIMDMEDTDAIVLLIGMADKILIVARSKVAELDVSQVLAEFGGGGHSTAASATIKDIPFEIIEERLIASLNKHVRPLKSVRDVMTTPVIVIQYNSKVKEAEDMMTRYGVNVLPVVKKDKYVGILTREVVEKALFHGFGKSKCIDFATTDVITVSADTPVSDVETSMIEQNQRFVPVLDKDKIIGAITRTDILRALYEDFLRKSRVSAKEVVGDSVLGLGRNISGMLKDKLPSHLYEFLKIAGAVADEFKFGAYLVGGCVRDILRGEENLDIDIVIEGDAIAFAKKLGEEIGAKVTTHERFGTAQVIKKDFKLDIATARTEYYESPAALPKVEMSSIKKDLYRRDFTINTLAVKLNKKDFGLLIDFFGGQRDLKDKVIRVLHNLSFIEDPTRAFRAIRFSERFGFKLTRHTENLIRSAIRMNIFEKLSGTRLYDELMLTFDETNPVKALKRLGDYELLKVIHPKISFSPELESLLQSVHDTITWFELLFLNEKYDKGMLYIMALLYKLNKEEREVALNRLSVTSRLKNKILNGLNAAKNILRGLKPDNPIEIYHMLEGHDIEFILFSMALTNDSEKKKAISHFLVKLRGIRPELKGDDLKALGISPGPEYSRIFKKILDEKLINRLHTKDEEIEFVKKLTKNLL
ncbi:poly(A) polymerase [Dissulfurispira thermophila]|uniref:Poly(A) polymerase n=2 Tax=root TaxID=1 RepID=A0A7G1GYX4_9BACT|nr:CBS domain-containing protein [Dissulfurispira thermophila]BCB95574.1 poly(A) polymerase [Dissulfurispira thermophila]